MKKGISNITLAVIILVIIALCVAIYFTVDKLWISNNNVTNNLQNNISEAPLYTMDNFPKIDASLATQPLTDAIISNFTGLDKSKIVTDYSNTHPAYVKLITPYGSLLST